MVTIIFILLIVFQIKHFLADYPLQNEYMLGKFKGGLDWVSPLALHAGVHGLFTFLICLVFLRNSEYGLPNALALAWFDFTAHFIVDRIKASPKLLGRFKSLDANCYIGAKNFSEGKIGTFTGKDEEVRLIKWGKDRLKENKYFWWSLGADQMAHHLTHYLIIYLILKFSF